MKFKEILTNYINDYKYNEPILIEEIKEYFKSVVREEEYKSTLNKLYVYLNRMINKGELNVFIKGVYYKGAITEYRIIEKKYIKDKDNIKGYLTKDSLLYDLGVIKSKPEVMTLSSNICIKGSRYKNNTLNVLIIKPRIKITNDNYKYLQLFDLVKLSVSDEVIENFIKINNLSYKKIFEYFKEISHR